MLRLWTNVTTSPLVERRRSSATAATAATSGPRAENNVTISSTPSSWPSRAPASTSATAPDERGDPGTSAGGADEAPEYHAVLRGPMWRTSMPSSTCSGVAGLMRCTRTAPGSSRPRPFGVAAVEHREAQAVVEPAVGVEGELGVDGEPGGEHEAGGLGHRPQAVEVGPGPLGVHVVGGDGGDPAPVVDARLEQHPEVVGQVGRRLQVDVHGQDQPGQGDGVEVLVAGAGSGPEHRRARLGQEVLDDDLLHVAPAGVGLGDGGQRVDAVLAGLADADEDAGGERDGQLAGCLERGQAALGGLVGRAPVGLEVRVERLDHHPLRGSHRPQGGELVGVEGAGVGVGQQTDLVDHQTGHGGQVGRPWTRSLAGPATPPPPGTAPRVARPG